jgi:Zn-dependent M28 family amino/carboxypeptidase
MMFSSFARVSMAGKWVPHVSILRHGKALTWAYVEPTMKGAPSLARFYPDKGGKAQLWAIGILALLTPLTLQAQQHFDGAKALEYTRQFVAIGPRWPTSPGHAKAEAWLKSQFQRNHDQFEDDAFTADTSIGSVPMHNFIVRYPGTKPGIIVLATHYETNYPLRNINFVGANDGGSTTGLLLAIGDRLREQAAQSPGKKLIGYSVWLLFDDGEESFSPDWIDSDALFGTRHLAAKWARDGTLSQIKAFILADMIGDKDLDIQHEANAAPWLFSLVQQAVKKFGYEKYFFKLTESVDDDHMPFVQRGVPTIDIIDLDYGPNNAYHHTAQDSMDKISARSLTIDGDVFLETIRLIDQRD